MSDPAKRIYFSAGPAKIPEDVMKQVKDELLDYKGLGLSVMEMSHRSKEFESIITDTEESLRELMKIPAEYAVLFMHGGAKTQFDSVPMNLCSTLLTQKTDYVVSGSWSKMAATEAEKYVLVNRQTPKSNKFDRQPEPNELTNDQEVAYRFYCENETIHGVEFNYVPELKISSTNESVPLVCDMTSNFLSRPVDVSKFGVIFAGAQKNSGIAGLTIVIVRKDLIGKHMSITPTIQNYKVTHEHRSLYNTPLTYAIYIAGLLYKWMLERGGLEAMDAWSRQKSKILYDLIDDSDGFYTCPVAKSSRSRMNVVFLLKDKDLEAKFLEHSIKAGLHDLKGHRSVGGCRASIYHGITVEDVKTLATFMDSFRRKYS